ncbi:similar to Saccharomyces cerevisiae YGR251W Essential protein required for maturation of 18S rRNA [Maudiozyma barnettii]|uniref:Similar to Saccharomyces cerevisiae YGR251W Essential protein required for maturation of 18S rRNA n=1 Tax=Maudiozyma barnettii TaxID=61262 RepID=A0A8H2VIY1_9SACH|nr:Nop19p [Kazachstania barnettii]CAB4256124.1 similar to Saccharomyces cerevisiae YGR251W Essential protein required for maturation of 18S rRNA [Kazachstania barnettii]CAD1784732.1 similar to Saccharomyces cerevisiae YGR251W Essential protein required for maturation of 18S rRNA [Kazachstania barnettii]
MSRAKEIQEKLALNAKLQIALNSNTSKVLSWLDSDKDDDNKKRQSDDVDNGKAYTIKDLEDSKKMFFQLPVVQIGSGLSMGDNDSGDNEGSTDIHTIGEFVNSNKKISSLAKKKKRSEHLNERNNIYRVAKDDTRAMVALKNKIRSGRREDMRRNGPSSSAHNNTSTSNNKDSSKGTMIGSDGDSSDDDGSRRIAHSKKSVNLLFNGKKKGRK